jgi:AcrR family transcriptional regulator
MAADRKEQILAAAYEIVGNEGIEGLHARSVAAKVGINHAAVHYYYAKRPDLLLAVTTYALNRFERDRQKLLSNASTPTERIDAHLAQVEAYCRPKSRFLRNWFSMLVASIGDEPVRLELVRHFRDWAAALKAELQQASKAKALRKGSPFMNEELLASTMLGLMVAAQVVGADFDASEKLDFVAGSLLV